MHILRQAVRGAPRARFTTPFMAALTVPFTANDQFCLSCT